MWAKSKAVSGSAALAVLAIAGEAIAAEPVGETTWFPIVAHVINLALLLGLLAYFGRRGIQRFLNGRAETVAKEIEEARLLHEEARARLEEYEARLASLQQEAEALLAEFRREGEAEKARLLAEAQAEAERITREAELATSNEVARARARLEAEVAERAIEVAERLLREQVTPDDARRLTNDYLGQLEQQAGA